MTHKFLFPETKERYKKLLLEKDNLIESVVDEELGYQLSLMMKFIGSGEKEKLQWFDRLRKEFNLPSDYKFE